MEIIVWQHNIKMSNKSVIFAPIAALSIYSMLIPFAFLDICLFLYQGIYFWYLNIPKIKRSQYFIFDRMDLDKLSHWQKINCFYCEYVNGLTAYAKAVANQTEIYSCAIKHKTKKFGQEHHQEFYERKKYR